MGQNAGPLVESRLVDPRRESQEYEDVPPRGDPAGAKALVNLNERRRTSSGAGSAFTATDERTLEEIADGLNLSRERVRQLEVIAKTKLRKHLICCAPTPLLAGG